MGRVDKVREQVERDARTALSFADAFHEYLDSLNYPGYAADLQESSIEAYTYEYMQFLNRYGGGSGGLEICEPVGC